MDDHPHGNHRNFSNFIAHNALEKTIEYFSVNDGGNKLFIIIR